MSLSEKIQKLREQIVEHDYRYYVLAQPIVSDREYDQLLDQLRKQEEQCPELITPDSPTQRVGGAPIDGFKHIRHAQLMLSIDNTYNEVELREFDQRVQKGLDGEIYQYIVDPKIDGVAASLRYEKGQLALVASRGDGETGDDITHTAKTIRAIPLQLRSLNPKSKIQIADPPWRNSKFPDILEVRGEIYWPLKDFERFNQQREEAGEPVFANPRNATAGAIKQLDPRGMRGRGLRFMAYGVGEVSVDFKSQSELFEYFKQWGIPINPHLTVCQTIDDVLTKICAWQDERHRWPYQSDGVVIKVNSFEQREILGATSRFPRWCIAYKFAAEQAETELLSVEFQVGKTGAVTPVAKLKPVLLAGTTVSNASLHNPAHIERLGLLDGDTVIIEKAGEIIPQVVDVVQSKRKQFAQPIKIPSFCPTCNESLSFDLPDLGKVAQRCINRECEDNYKVIQRKKPQKTCLRCGQLMEQTTTLPTLRCTNSNCPAQLRERLIHFASRDAMDIEGCGEVCVDTLLQHKLINNIWDLYHPDQWSEQLTKIPGYGKKSVQTLQNGIIASKSKPLSKLLTALNIPSVGTTTAEVLADCFENIDALDRASVEEIYSAITRAEKNKSKNTAKMKVPQSIYDYFKSSGTQRLIQELKNSGVNMIQPKRRIGQDSPLAGKTVVVTGTLKNFDRKEIENFIKDRGGKPAASVSQRTDFVLAGENAGSKLQKAQELGVQVLSEEDFLKLAGEPL